MNGQQIDVINKVQEWLNSNIDEMFKPSSSDERKNYYDKLKQKDKLLEKAEKIMKTRRHKMKMAKFGLLKECINNKNIQFEKKSHYVDRNIEDHFAFMGSSLKKNNIFVQMINELRKTARINEKRLLKKANTKPLR